jgi:L-alanine-DL-glutamate epimerase-like enolase superfamily enzyme
MKLKAVSVYKLHLPFKFTFAHARKSDTWADNIFVEILAADDHIRGYGEGAPRPIVTGETQEIAIRSVQSLCLTDDFPWDLEDAQQIWQFVHCLAGEKHYISAACALETALLDLLGKAQNRSIVDYLPKDYYTSEVRYGGTIPISDSKTVASICHIIRALEVTDVRLKLGKDFHQNRTALEVVRKAMDGGYNLRADVNCGWDFQMAKQHLPLLESYEVGTLEQPMMPDDPNWEDLANLLSTTNIRLMADESVYSMDDLEKAISEKYFRVFNIKLTKSWGFLNSLELIGKIRSAGLDYQVGCQVGESGILSAAGRALCAVSSDALYCDGCYDQFLLEQNLTKEHLTFGQRGIAKPLNGPGLGIGMNAKNLAQLTEDLLTIQRP